MLQTKAVAGAAFASLILIGGCAGNRSVQLASIEQAEQRIDEAERAEAQRYANRELNMAREKLLQAREAQNEGDEERAARLAQHAELDAAYAIALSDNESVQAAVNELRATLATLETELQRNQRPAPSSAGDIGRPSDDIDVSLRDEGLGIDSSDFDIDEPGDLEPADPLGPAPRSQSPNAPLPDRGL